MPPLSKFEVQNGDDWAAHQYPRVYVREQTSGPERLKVAASENGAELMLQLAAVLSEPFSALYVLLVPRGGSAEGRYQSPWLGRIEFTRLVEGLARPLDQDGRHHFWLFSGPDRATLVYDHHNVIFAYGPIEDYVRILEGAGYGEAQELQFPAPHRHQFHAAFDDDERRVTSSSDWQQSPLHDGDDY